MRKAGEVAALSEGDVDWGGAERAVGAVVGVGEAPACRLETGGF